MHPSILEAGPVVLTAVLTAALAAGLPAPARAAQPASSPAASRAAPPPVRSTCPAPQAAVQEAFIAADCADCWAAAGSSPAAAATAAGWRFDWITPATAEAPLAPAALAEAADRAQRAGILPPSPGGQRQADRPAAARLPGLVVAVASGPAWQGYFGIELKLQRGVPASLPAGSSAWLALVELVPAGSEGSAIARELVRTVAGPLPLLASPAASGAGSKAGSGAPLTHLRALRWPETAQPARLQARAWLEGPDGRILAVAADRCP